jgi:DNA-binding XRE family transcriptional regulator
MEANKVGRPSDYRAEYVGKVVDLGLNGASHAQIAKALGCSRKTLYAWQAENPEFNDAMGYARDLAQAWFEDIGQANMVAPTQGFKASLWAKQVSCRFADDYTDKTKQEITATVTHEQWLDTLK